jgi:ABC-2 type transport system ATP-binding protein
MSPLPLVVENARKTFGNVTALEARVGRSGARRARRSPWPKRSGKTTLIRAIGGRLALDSGSIRVFGRELSAADPRPDLGVVPQELAVYPLLTARENLGGVRAAVRRFCFGFAGPRAVGACLVRTRRACRESAKRFSGGMKRRHEHCLLASFINRGSCCSTSRPLASIPKAANASTNARQPPCRRRVGGVDGRITSKRPEQRCERIVIIDRGSIVAAGTPPSWRRALSAPRARFVSS